jgi:hypothetical protein
MAGNAPPEGVGHGSQSLKAAFFCIDCLALSATGMFGVWRLLPTCAHKAVVGKLWLRQDAPPHHNLDAYDDGEK